MRGLTPFAWLSRRLDRRIDARIAAHSTDPLAEGYRFVREAETATAVADRLPGHQPLVEEASKNSCAATAIADRMRGARQSPSSTQEEG
ncbi:hypothetical protein [Methylorubrum aminovorans]|uniref:hypothetical protein n=1 Tax=Methylorubrum aminovorans TaxID=269069 RepID=UPI003C2CD365